MRFALIIALLLAIAGCSGSFDESGGTYGVSLPSSDSVNAHFTSSGQSATVVGGPIQSSEAAQQR